MQNVMKIIYEGIMILLVILTIITLWTDSTFNSTINIVVWVVFFIDFLIRLFMAKEKWGFIKKNPFLIVAIIPVDQFFQIARIVRVFYFYRIKTIAKYYITPYVKRVTNRSFIWIILMFLTVLLTKATVIWQLEESVDTLYNAITVVFGHLLFFGHRIFIIENATSIWLLTITSVLGVVIQGLVLQWAFSKVEIIFNKLKKQRNHSQVS